MPVPTILSTAARAMSTPFRVIGSSVRQAVGRLGLHRVNRATNEQRAAGANIIDQTIPSASLVNLNNRVIFYFTRNNTNHRAQLDALLPQPNITIPQPIKNDNASAYFMQNGLSYKQLTDSELITGLITSNSKIYSECILNPSGSPITRV